MRWNIMQVEGIRAPLRGLMGLVVVGGLGGALPACLLPDSSVPDGTLAKGSCMCAMCLDRPFCMDAARTTTKIDEEGSCTGDPDHPLMAVETWSVADPDDRSAKFFCIPDDGKFLGWGSSPGCNPDPAAHGAEENVNPCIDLPVNCIDKSIVTSVCGKMPDPSEPPCPEGAETGSERIACGLGSQNEAGYLGAVNELITSCKIWGGDVPNGNQAERFCFLGCLDFDFSGHEPGAECEFEEGFPPVPYTCYESCDTAMFNSPEVTESSLRVTIDPAQSRADMVIHLNGQTYSPSVQVGGTIALDLGQECWGPLPPGQSAVCTASLPFVDLNSLNAFTVAGTQVWSVSVLNPNPIHGDDDALTVRNASFLTLSAGQQLYITAEVAGNAAQNVFSIGQPLTASVDWDARTFDLTGFFDDPQGNATLSLVLHGTLPNLGPKSDAGPPQILECTSPAGAPAALSAAASTDPDGLQDLTSFVWTSTVNGVPWDIGGIAVTTPPVPIGTTPFGLAVVDRSGVTSYASTSVSVQDTTPPAFGPLTLATSCLWPPDHKMHLFRLGQEIAAPASDTCDPAPFVRIVDVASSQGTVNDVVFGSDALCVRAETPRVYTVILEVSDLHGNVSQENFQITVAGDQGQCTTGDAAPAVTDDEPRCTTAAGDP